MKKIYDITFEKGEHDDDSLYQHMRDLNHISHKPLKENGEEDDFSYLTVLEKKVRIVVYIGN